MTRTFLAAALSLLAGASPSLRAQHEGMDMSGMHHSAPMNDAETYLMNLASGTGMNPLSWQMPMLMTKYASWNFTTMGQAFLVDTRQSGPRGADKFYSANWLMASAEHRLAGGSMMIQTMLSLDPATITGRRYPLLFQTGETAYGKLLADAQHPHEFVMSLGISYAHPAGPGTMLQLYYAPVGDPALGPVAFPHRASAFEIPQATLGHHWQDATHIVNNVATVSLRHKWLRLEASGFHGAEPDENRWNIDRGAMDSWAGRVSLFPAKNWMAQVSAGRIANPERQTPGDVVRATASLHYTRPMTNNSAWSTSLIWGRNHDTVSRHNLNSYLAETVYPLSKKHFLTARAESVDKDELIAARTFRVEAYTAGYTRDIGSFRNLEAGIGVNATAYAVPPEVKPYYGNHPRGANLFLRLRLRPGK